MTITYHIIETEVSGKEPKLDLEINIKDISQAEAESGQSLASMVERITNQIARFYGTNIEFNLAED